jgi:hypothetical protein
MPLIMKRSMIPTKISKRTRKPATSPFVFTRVSMITNGRKSASNNALNPDVAVVFFSMINFYN